ncbi:peptidoglycan DD-metalloendopeptidase family protein [Kordiimonas marina]|uniref:peptidoglycan DD-metalloendopeptidase family protein n=1 Tax=Kordiimonas marina TaxID=2872312 RepID=UPI001FF2436F|nr:peptidoglycan DD-metalloendopeptidase family protein [Kordiimonas marina]MCJ9430439.1 peptidoglycan DD-metalloendopeptidase family protein [Kordiimonas marina]
MADWRKIRERFLAGKTWTVTGKRLFDVIRSSESPVGFIAMAGIGLLVVLLLNMGPDENAGDADADDTVSVAQASGTPTAETAVDESAAADDGDTAGELPDDAAIGDTPDTRTETFRLQRRETLSGLLKRAHIDTGNAAEAIAELRTVTNLRRLRPGQQLHLTRAAGAPNKIEHLSLRDSFAATAEVKADGDGYKADRVTIPTMTLTRLVEGTIDDNLYVSAKKAGLPDKVIVELIRLMSFDVDFERDIRDGDRFQVYFERTYAPTLHETKDGRILQIKLALKRGDYEATYFKTADGRGDYYDADGKSARRALMKTPLDVTVVTSSYGRRRHPVLGYTRMHKGVDFRASIGTPVMAAGDGVVERASRWGSYGNYLRIRHNGTYSTAYGHLSRYAKGIHRGAHVRQGQIIAYSGATGRVNGPHLHYEVLIHGKQTNPMTLKLPSGKSLTGKTLTAYKASRDHMLADISHIEWSNRALLAQAQAETKATPLSQDGSIMPTATTSRDTGLDGRDTSARLSVEP